MKTVGSSLATHLAGTTTTVALLIRVERADGTIYGFTDHDADIFYGGLLYRAGSAIGASAVVGSDKLSVDNLEINGALESAAITAEDLDAGRWDFAQVQIRLVNWADLTQGAVYLKRGELGRVTRRGGAFVAELLGLTLRLQRTIGRTILPTCDVKRLGDARCGVGLSSFTESGTVTSVTSQTTFADNSLAQSAGYFRRGTLLWITGDNAGISFNVAEHATGGVITLDRDAPAAIAVGDSFEVVAGCDRTFATCRDTFDNVLHFRGFPYVPGRDKLIGEAVDAAG